MKDSGVLLWLISCVLLASSVRAQPVPATETLERFGIGGVAGPGTAGALASARLSVPAAQRVSFDIDLGLLSASSDRARAAAGVQVRWLRRQRQANGSSDYGIFGVMHAREERRSEFRFPDEHIVRTERINGFSPVIGYGLDWLAANGTRVGVELTGGGSLSAGPRLFAKLFAVWAPR